MTKEILLTKGYVALVDDDDYEVLVSMGKWMVITGNGGYYAGRNRPSLQKRIGMSSFVFMHNMIMNPPDGLLVEGMTVDHKDLNGLNNKRSNLRYATYSQQQINQEAGKNNSSGHKGVSWDKSRNLWSAEIHVSGKKIFIGRYGNVDDAALAYKRKAIEIYGDFAR